jgi:hypothetical protein
LDRLITNFDREFKTSIANTTVQANKRRSGRGEAPLIGPIIPRYRSDNWSITDLSGKHRLGMVLLSVILVVHNCPLFGKGTNSVGSLYEYCRIIVHSFGHKAESNHSSPLMRPSTYVATVCTVVFVETASRLILIRDGAQCMEAALALLDLWLNDMHSIGHVPYAPDFFFVGTGFAGAFLLEVRSPFSTPHIVSLIYQLPPLPSRSLYALTRSNIMIGFF